MFKRLGIFAILAVCLFAIAMVGCGNGDDEDEKKIVVPPVEETKEKTFKEQLVGSSWRMVTNADGVSINAAGQAFADEFAQGIGIGFPLKGTMTENSLRFDNSGKGTFNFGVRISNPNDPADSFEISMSFKGPYFVDEDSGSSATMSLSFTEVVAFKLEADGDAWEPDEDEREAFAAEAGIFGDFFTDERASINGDQLRIGQMLLERN